MTSALLHRLLYPTTAVNRAIDETSQFSFVLYYLDYEYIWILRVTLNLHNDRDIQRLNKNWEERQTDDVHSRFEGNLVEVEVPKLFWVDVSVASNQS